MRIKLYLFVSLLIGCNYCSAQRPEETLERWALISPIEKVYLHFDRDVYFAGETAWFKAYMYSDFMPGSNSTSLYTELLNASGKVISNKIYPIVFGSAIGQFELKDSLPSGQYFIRAFSPTMLNQSKDFLFQRSIYVSGLTKEVEQQPAPKSVFVHLFPEAGNVVAGVVNAIAFKVTSNSELPETIHGVVRDQKGDSITSFSTYHDGMGKFEMTPVKGNEYYVQLETDQYNGKTYLPPVLAEGVVFRLTSTGAMKKFELFQQTKDPSLRAAYMIGQTQHHVAFRNDFATDNDEAKGSLDTRTLPSGVLHITVFNKDGIPLAERLCFVDNKEYIQNVTFITDTLNYEKRSKNKFTLQFPDSISCNFSVAIINEDFSIKKYKQNSIVSSLLLTSDIRGPINDPHYYFLNDDDSTKEALDLVMMINGWRRFHWATLSAGLVAKPLPYKDPGYIQVAGDIKLRDSKKLLPENEFIARIRPVEDSTLGTLHLLSTDKQGKFKIDSLIFYGKTKFYINDNRVKKSRWIDVYPNAVSMQNTFALPAFDASLFRSSRLRIDLNNQYDNYINDNYKALGNVIVKARKKSVLEELEDKYSSGLFSGAGVRTIDLVNTNEKLTQNNIFEYIQGRVPGIQVQRDGLDYTLNYRQSRTLTGGPIPMTLFLDEIQTSADIIATIPASQIAMIKVFSSFVGAAGGGMGGALAIYTKKHEDMVGSTSSAGAFFTYEGYSIVKEFYSPDYNDIAQAASKPDTRPAIYWQPNIFVDGYNEKVPISFYNDDRCKSFKVVVEGITAEGKLLYFEKVLGTAKGF